jgi:iron-sulfur cluster assembly accessory protein
LGQRRLPEEAIVGISLTPGAIGKVKEIIEQQDPPPAGLRIGVVGGGCSGFSYSMVFEENGKNDDLGMDKVYTFEGLKVFVDQTSLLYLENTEVDYIETLEGSGFKFSNPNVKGSCGCGESFSV